MEKGIQALLFTAKLVDQVTGPLAALEAHINGFMNRMSTVSVGITLPTLPGTGPMVIPALDGFRAAIESTTQALNSIDLSALVEGMESLIDTLQDVDFDALSSGLKALTSGVTGAASNVGGVGSASLDGMFDALRTLTEKLAPTTSKTIPSAPGQKTWLGAQASNMYAYVTKPLDTMVLVLKDVAQSFKSAAKSMGGGIMNLLGGKLGGFVSLLLGGLKFVVGSLVHAVQWVGGVVWGIVKNIFGFVTGAISAVFSRIRMLVSTIVGNTISPIFDMLINILQPVLIPFQFMLAKLVMQLMPLVSRLAPIMMRLTDVVGTYLMGLLDKNMPAIERFIDKIPKYLEDLWGFVSPFVDAIKEIGAVAWPYIKGALKMVSSFLVDMFNQYGPLLKDLIEYGLKKFGDWLGVLAGKAKSAMDLVKGAPTFFNGFVDYMLAMVGWRGKQTPPASLFGGSRAIGPISTTATGVATSGSASYNRMVETASAAMAVQPVWYSDMTSAGYEQMGTILSGKPPVSAAPVRPGVGSPMLAPSDAVKKSLMAPAQDATERTLGALSRSHGTIADALIMVARYLDKAASAPTTAHLLKEA